MRVRLMFASLVALLFVVVGVRMGAQTPDASTERKLELKFDGNGYVTLVAQNVSVSEIFAQWARVGGTRILNAEKLPARPISVQFDSTPELKLVESLIRLSKAVNPGWITVPRQVSAPVTPSRLETISILPSSSPTSSYMGTTSQAPMYPQTSPDDELPPVMPPVNAGPAQAPPPQQAPAKGGGPGIPVIPVGGPGTTGTTTTPLPGGGRSGRG